MLVALLTDGRCLDFAILKRSHITYLHNGIGDAGTILHKESYRYSYKPHQAKTCLQTCSNYTNSDHPASGAKYLTGSFSPFIHSIVFTDYVRGQSRP